MIQACPLLPTTNGGSSIGRYAAFFNKRLRSSHHYTMVYLFARQLRDKRASTPAGVFEGQTVLSQEQLPVPL